MTDTRILIIAISVLYVLQTIMPVSWIFLIEADNIPYNTLVFLIIIKIIQRFIYHLVNIIHPHG